MILKLSKNTLKKSAAECKKFLEERYSKKLHKDDVDVSKKDIQDTIDHYYPKEEEEKKAKLNGNTSATEQESSTPKK